MTFDITRDKIPIYSIDAAHMVDKKIGYIKVSRFAKTTMDEFRDAILSLQDQGMKDLILDLQGNGGGMLRTGHRHVGRIPQRRQAHCLHRRTGV